MWVAHDSIYRVETVKGDKLVVAVGIKPDMDSGGDCGTNHHLLHIRVKGGERMSYNYDCIHECGDDDCGKCMVRGIIMYCPSDCPDYESRFPKPTEKPKPKPQKDDKLTRIEGVVKGCEEILSDPDSTPIIRKCAIDTAYKHIARIIKGAENG